MVIKIVLLLVFSILTACGSKNDNTRKISVKEGPPAPCEDRSSPLYIVGQKDTLKILIEFPDFGEWGGHREKIYLQRNKENRIFVRFIKDTVTSGEIIEKNGFGTLDDNSRHVLIDKVKMLTNEDEKLFSRFLQRLLELYLKGGTYGNSGSIYHITTTDKSLKFTYWNSGDCRDTYYNKIRRQVFGEILKIK